MKNLQSATAIAILKNLDRTIQLGVPLSPADIHNVNDATDHTDIAVAVAAFEIIEKLANKAPYETSLIYHANRHNDQVRATCAYRAMRGAYDINPFIATLTFGTRPQVQQLIAYQAIVTIRHEAETYNIIPKNLQPAVTNALSHPSISVVVEGCRTLEALNDITPFMPTLNMLISANQSGVLRSRINTLLNTHYQKTMNPALVPQETVKTSEQALDRVLLDFNIPQNGAGTDLHVHDAVQRLSALFQDSARKDGMIHGKARVFYDPSTTLEENSIIDVTLPIEAADDILRATLRYESPAFTLTKAGNALFRAKPMPS